MAEDDGLGYLLSMTRSLPPWVVSNEESVRREVSRYRNMTPEERGVILAMVCDDAAALIETSGRAEQIRTWRDPLPPSTVLALKRLQTAFKARRRDGARL